MVELVAMVSDAVINRTDAPDMGLDSVSRSIPDTTRPDWPYTVIPIAMKHKHIKAFNNLSIYQLN